MKFLIEILISYQRNYRLGLVCIQSCPFPKKATHQRYLIHFPFYASRTYKDHTQLGKIQHTIYLHLHLKGHRYVTMQH